MIGESNSLIANFISIKKMSFWGRHDWLSNGRSCEIIHTFDKSKVDEAGYRLSVGREVYLPDSDGSKVTTLEDGDTFFIAAGQFAFILTEESVNIPLDMIGFISVRAGIKFHGLVNVSGFHVDPGYTGNLVFAVFNSGPTRINLKQGQEIFSLWVAELKTPNEETDRPKKGHSSLHPDLLNKIDGNHLTAYQVSDNIEEVRKLAKTNQDDLRKIKNYFWLAVTVISLVIFPIFRVQIKNIMETDFVSQYMTGDTQSQSPAINAPAITPKPPAPPKN